MLTTISLINLKQIIRTILIETWIAKCMSLKNFGNFFAIHISKTLETFLFKRSLLWLKMLWFNSFQIINQGKNHLPTKATRWLLPSTAFRFNSWLWLRKMLDILTPCASVLRKTAMFRNCLAVVLHDFPDFRSSVHTCKMKWSGLWRNDSFK